MKRKKPDATFGPLCAGAVVMPEHAGRFYVGMAITIPRQTRLGRLRQRLARPFRPVTFLSKVDHAAGVITMDARPSPISQLLGRVRGRVPK